MDVAPPAPHHDVAESAGHEDRHRRRLQSGLSTRRPSVRPLQSCLAGRCSPTSTRHAQRRRRSAIRGDAPSPRSAPVPGRHVRRLHSQKADRREWNPTQPVTGRHVLPLGGPAVGAADRDRRLWLFGAVTVVLMVLGLLVGRQVTQTGPLAAATNPRSTPGGSRHALRPRPRRCRSPRPTPAPTAGHPDGADARSSSRASRRSAPGAVGSRLPTFATASIPMTSAWCSTWRFPNTVTGESDHGDRLRRADDAVRRVHRRQRSIERHGRCRPGRSSSRWCRCRWCATPVV